MICEETPVSVDAHGTEAMNCMQYLDILRGLGQSAALSSPREIKSKVKSIMSSKRDNVPLYNLYMSLHGTKQVSCHDLPTSLHVFWLYMRYIHACYTVVRVVGLGLSDWI